MIAPTLVTIREAASRLALAEATLRNWVADLDRTRRGQPHRPTPLRVIVRLGRAVRIPLAEVERLQRDGTVTTEPRAKPLAAARARLEGYR